MLARSQIKAPVAGTVLKIFHRVGDTTSHEPILQIAAGEGMVVVAEVYATKVHVLRDWLEKGKKVNAIVTSPALGEAKLKGTVNKEEDIAKGVARNMITGFNPRGDADRRVVEVRVALDKEAMDTASKYIGLDVEVTFEVESR
jgi:multidrug resistance efflux pump